MLCLCVRQFILFVVLFCITGIGSCVFLKICIWEAVADSCYSTSRWVHLLGHGFGCTSPTGTHTPIMNIHLFSWFFFSWFWASLLLPLLSADLSLSGYSNVPLLKNDWNGVCKWRETRLQFTSGSTGGSSKKCTFCALEDFKRSSPFSRYFIHAPSLAFLRLFSAFGCVSTQGYVYMSLQCTFQMGDMTTSQCQAENILYVWQSQGQRDWCSRTYR